MTRQRQPRRAISTSALALALAFPIGKAVAQSAEVPSDEVEAPPEQPAPAESAPGSSAPVEAEAAENAPESAPVDAPPDVAENGPAPATDSSEATTEPPSPAAAGGAAPPALRDVSRADEPVSETKQLESSGAPERSGRPVPQVAGRGRQSSGHSLGLSGEGERKPSEFLVAATVEPSLMMGELAEYAGSFGIAGFGIGLRYLGLAPFRFGAAIGWHSVSETRQDSISQGEGTYTGTMIKELSFTPLLMNVGYAFGEAGARRGDAVQSTPGSGKKKKIEPTPYISLGAGASLASRRADFGIASVNEELWHFTVVPEFGVEVPVGPVHIVGSLRLHLLLPAGGYGAQNYASLGLGIGFR